MDGEKIAALELDHFPLKQDKTECLASTQSLALMTAEGNKTLLGANGERLPKVLNGIAQVRPQAAALRLPASYPSH